jgi:hypothetical protein
MSCHVTSLSTVRPVVSIVDNTTHSRLVLHTVNEHLVVVMLQVALRGDGQDTPVCEGWITVKDFVPRKRSLSEVSSP